MDHPGDPRLLAVADLHVGYPENAEVVARLAPAHPGDWLLVVGDVAERAGTVLDTLASLRDRFSRVLWAPGNHELWSTPRDPVRLAGEERYRYLVEGCRARDVLTPEDPYPVWRGPGGPATVAPLFLLYDYGFRDPGTDVATALARARAARVVCTDEAFLDPAPHPDRQTWCAQLVARTEARLQAAADPAAPFVLAGHWPLLREPTLRLRYPEFALWCGTPATADWHRRFPTRAVVYGHLHIPRTTVHDGVPFEEVSLGYPREWRHRPFRPDPVRTVLPRPPWP